MFERLPLIAVAAMEQLLVSGVGASLDKEMVHDTSWSSSADESAALAALSAVLHLNEFHKKLKLPLP